MSPSSGSGLQIKDLPGDANKEARECGERLSKANEFTSIGKNAPGDYEVWNDNGKLEELSRAVVKSMESILEASAAVDIRITAVRFSQTATVPVKKGSSVFLIPVHVTSGTPSISNISIDIGQYVHLTESAPVELTETTLEKQSFICLLLLSG